MDDNVIRIKISSDNHLGFSESDSVRCDDSFATFEEVLYRAREDKCDLVLLGGDLFHYQKPSRRTLHSTIQLLRKYCYGDNPVYLELLNSEDDTDIFETPTGLPNFLDPYQAVDLPVFAIHGNHDEPSHDRGMESLSALDILSASNMINYFGKMKRVDDIKIKPVCLQKKTTCVAIYALGAMNDERLSRMFEQNKVSFERPESTKYFHILVVHQNADKGRGKKNCLNESYIPEWMDLVVWGNEHECRNELIQTTGASRIYQPGSSIVTSFHDTESIAYPKHMGQFEIMTKAVNEKPLFRLKKDDKHRYTQCRPFLLKDVSLSEVESLNALDTDIETKMTNLLLREAKDAIRECQEHAKLCNNGPPDMIYKLKEPSRVLVRLRVEHTGFSTINPQRFGAQFMKDVANPQNLLYFHKRRKTMKMVGSTSDDVSQIGSKRKARPSSQANNIANHNHEEGEEGEEEPIKIEELVTKALEQGKKKLEMIGTDIMAGALESFVSKMYVTSIPDVVEKAVDSSRKQLYKHNIDDSNQIREFLNELIDNQKTSSETQAKKLKSSNARASTANREEANEKNKESSPESSPSPAPKKRGRTNKASKGATNLVYKTSSRTKRAVTKEMSYNYDDDSDMGEEANYGEGYNDVEEDEDEADNDEFDIVETTKRKPRSKSPPASSTKQRERTTVSKSTSKSTSSKSLRCDDEELSEVEEVDLAESSEEEEVAPVKSTPSGRVLPSWGAKGQKKSLANKWK